MEINSNHERNSELRKYVDNYDWSGLELPLSIKGINTLKKNNDISANVLGVEENKVHIQRRTKHIDRKKVVNLLLIADDDCRHYMAIKGCSEVVIININVNSISV